MRRTKKGLTKATIFVSYADADRATAVRFREWLVGATGGTIDVFVAADREALPLGDLWYEAITRSLAQADMVIVLVSIDALRSPWVAYEAGHASALKKPILPLLLPGVPPQLLRSPLSFRQYVAADSSDVLTQLVTKLNEQFQTRFVVNSTSTAEIFENASYISETELDAIGLTSRQDIYDEIVSLVNSVRGPLYMRATATLREAKGFTDRWFESYLAAIAAKFGQAATAGAASEFILVMAFPLMNGNMPPDDRAATIRQRQHAFENAGAPDRLRLFHTPEQWRLDVLTIGEEHVVIGFPAREGEPRMRNAVRITGREFVSSIVRWFDHFVLPTATPIDPITLRVERNGA